jgi:hypothetical protein
VGDWIIYYEPRKIAETRGYFAIAKVREVISDPGAPGMYLALIEPGSYLDFARACLQLRRMIAEARWIPARKFLASLS